MGNSSIFGGGVPTGPEVNALFTAFPPIKGEIVRHDQIEAVTKLEHGSSRYRTVVTAWRARVLRETGTFTEALPNVGILFMNDEHQLTAGIKHVKGSGKRMAKAGVLFESINPSNLTQEQQSQCTHGKRITATLFSEIAQSKKVLAAAGKPVALPRVGPPKKP